MAFVFMSRVGTLSWACFASLVTTLTAKFSRFSSRLVNTFDISMSTSYNRKKRKSYRESIDTCGITYEEFSCFVRIASFFVLSIFLLLW